MERFSKKIAVGKETKLFEFTRMENVNGVKFFIKSTDADQKPFACSLKKSQHGTGWKLVPGSMRWLYDIEEELSNAIMETRLS
jgi:hypothetical protein